MYESFDSGVMPSIHLRDAHHVRPGIALLGFASDEGVRRNSGRVGAHAGPLAIKGQLCKAGFPDDKIIYDAGLVSCEGKALEAAQSELGEAVRTLRAAGHFVIVIGGGHETALGHYMGLEEHALNIVNFDAHFDLREHLPDVGSTSGTPFFQIAQHCQDTGHPFLYHVYGIQPISNQDILFERARAYAVDYLLAEHISKLDAHIEKVIQAKLPIYVTLCLDVFHASICPGVSAPQEKGLMPHTVLPCLARLAASGLVCAFDIVEYAPKYDVNHISAKLAVTCLLEMVENGYTCLSEWTHTAAQ